METIDSTLIYIDESGHLTNNGSIMVLGAVWGSKEALAALTGRIKGIKEQFEIAPRREVKWTKVSPRKLDYYKALTDAFCEMDGINYRAIVINKNLIHNDVLEQSEDDFYYKMTYLLVRNIVEKRPKSFRIYLDYKDTQSNNRCKELANFLGNTAVFAGREFEAQPIRSYESTPLQIADLFNGVLAYANKTDTQSEAKKSLVEYVKEKSELDLKTDTPRYEEKFNLLFWEPKIKL